MDLKVSAQRLCLLLSWQEALQRSPEKEPFGGARYRRQAAQGIQAIRAEAEKAIQETATHLQAQMARNASEADLAPVRHRIQQLNRLLKVTRAEELGGPVAMPLPDYAATVGEKKPGPFQFTRWERQGFITIGLSLVLMTALCLGLAWFQLWRANVDFRIESAGAPYLALFMENKGQHTASFVGSAPTTSLADSELAYDVTIWCKALGQDSFQPCSAPGDVWIYNSEVLAPQRAVSVESGVTVTLLLDLDTLEKSYGEPLEAVRLECGLVDGRRQARFTHVVSDSP